ncbi:hypothetical protein [Robertkochia sediminum]|uniref:hypothetical protein n=1 Tax=Robertkochia sediminum TaxID=2785326 RepID=UPI001931EA87|nr:hypothetical protein [Robertkochia sediminum]MBL7472566.1 hypothetical protein [Robertkochia sediminum]
MVTTWIFAFALFITTSLLFWWSTRGYYKKQLSKTELNQWSTRTYRWQGVIFVGTGVTLLIILLMKWAGMLPL